MCEGNCFCGIVRHHGHHRPRMGMDYPFPLMNVDEEIKILEEYKEALTKRLEQVNKIRHHFSFFPFVEKFGFGDTI